MVRGNDAPYGIVEYITRPLFVLNGLNAHVADLFLCANVHR